MYETVRRLILLMMQIIFKFKTLFSFLLVVVIYIWFGKFQNFKLNLKDENAQRFLYNEAIRYYKNLSTQFCNILLVNFRFFIPFVSSFFFVFFLIYRIDILFRIVSLVFYYTVVILANLCSYVYKVIIYIVSKLFYCISLVCICTGLVCFLEGFISMLSPPYFLFLIYKDALIFVYKKVAPFLMHKLFLYNLIVGFFVIPYVLITEYVPAIFSFVYSFVKYIYVNFSFFFYCVSILLLRWLFWRICLLIFYIANACFKFADSIFVFICKIFNMLQKLLSHMRSAVFAVAYVLVVFYLCYLAFTCVILPLFVCYLGVIFLIVRPLHFIITVFWRSLLYVLYVLFRIKLLCFFLHDFVIRNRHFYKDANFYNGVLININKIFYKIFLLVSNFKRKLKNAWRFFLTMDLYDTYVLSVKLVKKLVYLEERVEQLVYLFFVYLIKFVLLLLSPIIWLIRPFWNFFDKLTLPIQDILWYKSYMPRRTPFEDLNKEEREVNIAANAARLNRNTNAVFVPLFMEILGQNIREFMFDSFDDYQMFRNDFDYLEADQYTFAYIASFNDCSSQEHAEYHALFAMYNMEDITGDPRSLSYHPMKGPAFARETFTISLLIKSIIKAWLPGTREVTKWDMDPEIGHIHAFDEHDKPIYSGFLGDVFPAGNALKKRIGWFLKYYKYMSKRAELLMNGQLSEKDFNSLKEEVKKEKIFSKKYKRKHSYRSRLIYDIERPGFLYLSPTFLSKVESFLKKDLSEFFFVYGDSQFNLQDRFSPRMMYHGVLNLLVLFFIIAYIMIPDEEMVLFYQLLFVTIILICAWLLFIIYFSIFERRAGLISRKSLSFDGRARAVPELLAGWGVLMFFILTVYYIDIILTSWETADVVYLQNAWHNDGFLLDWLLGLMTDDDNFVFNEYYAPMLSMVERAQLLNKSVWNGQFINPAYILYATDLKYTRETCIHFMFSHYKYLWQNVPSPIIAIIGDTCMFIKERYRGHYNWVEYLPSSFAIQNFLLDLKYKTIYAKLLELDVALFSFLKSNLCPEHFNKICLVAGAFANLLAYIKYVFVILFGWDTDSTSVSFLKAYQIKISQFSPQIRKLEEDLSSRSFETISTSTFFEDLWSCVLGDMPVKIREMPTVWYRIDEFPFSVVLLSIFSYIFKFFFFDIYVFLGFPFYHYSTKIDDVFELYFKWGYGLIAEKSYPASQEQEKETYFRSVMDDDYNRDDNYIISSHDLLDDYSFSHSRTLLLGQEFLAKARFALSPKLEKNYTVFSSGNGDFRHLIYSSSYLNVYSIANKLKEVSMLSLFATPWEVIMHSATSVYDRSLRNFFDRYWYGIGTMHEDEFSHFMDNYYEDFLWNKVETIKKNEFLLSSSVDANHAMFGFTELTRDECSLNVSRFFNHQHESGLVEFDIYIPYYYLHGFLKHNLLLFENWGNENFMKYGATIDHMQNYSIIQKNEMAIRDVTRNPGGSMSNVLYFFYSSVAKCLFNERFFSSQYNYPLFFDISENFKSRCVLENVSSNLLMNSGYITDCKMLHEFERRFDESYNYIARGTWDEPFEERIGEKYLQDQSKVIEVPQLNLGNLRVINKSSNLFEFFFNNLLEDSKHGGKGHSASQVYLRLSIGDEYSYTHLTSKFYDGFLYYSIERNGKVFVIPIDIWLRNNAYFNDQFFPDYDSKSKKDYNTMYNTMTLSEIYFKSLDDFSFYSKTKTQFETFNVGEVGTNAEGESLSPAPPLGSLLNVHENFGVIYILDGRLVEEYRPRLSAFFENCGKGLYVDKYENENLILKSGRHVFSYTVKGFRLCKNCVLYVPYRIIDVYNYFNPYKDNRPKNVLDLSLYEKDLDPYTIVMKHLPIWQQEFEMLFNIWEDTQEYFLEMDEEIEEDGPDDYSLAFHRYYRENFLDCDFYMWFLVDDTDRITDEHLWAKDLEALDYFDDVIDRYKDIDITSPYLVDCKSELFELLKEEIVAGSLEKACCSDGVCFYNMFTESFRRLLNQFAAASIVSSLGVYDLPKYCDSLQHFFELNS